MEWDVIEVKLAGEFEISVRFEDGVEGVVKFLPTAFRGVFSHLRDESQFQQVKVIDGVVTWHPMPCTARLRKMVGSYWPSLWTICHKEKSPA